MEPIVSTRPTAGDWVSTVRLQPGRPVQHQRRPAASRDAVTVPVGQPVQAGPVAIGSLFSEVLARYGLAPPASQPYAPAVSEPVDLVA